MNVSAIVVTRGNVDLQPVLDSLPKKWERVVWDNGRHVVTTALGSVTWQQMIDLYEGEFGVLPDLSVYGRYAAIEHAQHDLIYVQDDDVIVSDPAAIVDEWVESLTYDEDGPRRRSDHLVANMPQEFRHDGYADSCLVGFGACFHRDAPARAFDRFDAAECLPADEFPDAATFFHRTADVVFTTLTPRVLVDVPKTDREFASDDDRMWKQPDHHGERTRMLELARAVRDA